MPEMPLEWTGVAGKVADGLNEVIIANETLEAELARVSRRGRTAGQAQASEWSSAAGCKAGPEASRRSTA